MLTNACVPHQMVEVSLDEETAKIGLTDLAPRAMAEHLAALKAGSAAAAAGDLVLGADQVLELDDGAMLSKPGSRDEAATQLRRMSGRTHQLHSAAMIMEAGRPVWRATESVVMTMRPIGADFIHAYLEREYEFVRWNVGCYRIEGRGAQLFSAIEGSHFAILGLPLLPLLAYLRERGVITG